MNILEYINWIEWKSALVGAGAIIFIWFIFPKRKKEITIPKLREVTEKIHLKMDEMNKKMEEVNEGLRIIHSFTIKVEENDN